MPSWFRKNIFDIDFFKNVNDTYGHAGGDEILKSFATLLNTEISEPNQVGRIGGEEFLAILYIDEDTAETFIKDLINKIQKNSIEYENQTINITSSGGVAFSNESENASDLVNKADKRLYMAKKSGRNRFVLNNSEISGEKWKYYMLKIMKWIEICFQEDYLEEGMKFF